MTAVIDSADFKARLAANAFAAESSTPDELAGWIREEIAKFSRVIRTAGIKVN